MNNGRLLVTTIVLMTAFFGCETTFTVRQPDGFAVYTRETETYRAIAPDGVRYRAFSRKNEPRGDEGMWGEMIRTSLLARGYRLSSEKSIAGRDNRRGRLYEYDYWYNGEDFRYCVGLYVDGEVLYIIEACGTADAYTRRRKDIITSIESFTVSKN